MLCEPTEETGQETIIRDCIAIPMKQGCERRQMSNYKLYGGPAHTVIQCVYTCHEYNGCNGASQLSVSVFGALLMFVCTAWSVQRLKADARC